MHAITHLIHLYPVKQSVRTESMRIMAMHLERAVEAADRGENCQSLAEGGSGSVLQGCSSEARKGSCETVIRGREVSMGCKRCGEELKPSIAIEQTFSGSPDFAGVAIVTMSPGGPGRLIGCMKCSACGWSVS